MKVGLITWYSGNYGSALQAIALQKAVSDNAGECEIVRFKEGNLAIGRKVRRLLLSGPSKTFLFYKDKLSKKRRDSSVSETMALRS